MYINQFTHFKLLHLNDMNTSSAFRTYIIRPTINGQAVRSACFIALISVLLFSACKKESEVAPEPEPALRDHPYYRVDYVDGFYMTIGSAADAERYRALVWSALFDFEEDGDFTYQFEYNSETTYTLSGEYYKTGNNEYYFSAVQVHVNTGTQLRVEGRVTVRSKDHVVVEMEFGISDSMSTIQSNQEFFQNAYKRFNAILDIH